MTFGEYVEILKGTGYFGNNKADIGLMLFKIAGTHEEISKSAIKKWLKNSDECNIHRYFPDESLNIDQFVKYFKSKTKAPASLKEMQNAFRMKISANLITGDCAVDLDTNDCDVFIWSLLNQFQRIFHLVETDYKSEDSSSSGEKSSAVSEMATATSHQTELSNHIVNTFKKEYYLCQVDNFLQEAHESLKLYHHEYEPIDYSSPDAVNEILEQEMRKQTLPQYVLSMIPKVERFLTNIQRVMQNANQFNITEEAAKCVFIDIRQYIDTLQCFISDFEKFVKYRESSFSIENTMTAFDLDDSLKDYESKLNDLFASITKA